MKGYPAWMVMGAVVIFLAAGLSSCAEPQSQSSGSPADIVMTSCTKCHPAKPICAALGKKDRGAWNATVARMVEKGANVDQARVPELAEYLAGLKPGSPPVCR